MGISTALVAALLGRFFNAFCMQPRDFGQGRSAGFLRLARQAKPPAFTEVISPLPEVQISCEQLIPNPFKLVAVASTNTK